MNRILNLSGIVVIVFLAFSCDRDSNGNSASATQVPSTGNPTIDNLTKKILYNPNDPTLYAGRAGAYYQVGGYDEAIADLSTALRYDSTNVEYQHVLADIYMDYYKSSLALTTMEHAAKMHPERIPTLLKLSEFQLILKQNSASLKTIDQVLKLNANESEAYFMMGRNFYDMDDIPRAIGSFQKAVRLNSDLLEGWVYLGELFDKKDSEDAIKHYDNALDIDSTNLDALNGKAAYYHQRGKLDEAIAIYKKTNRMHPQYSDAYYRAGLAFLEKDSANTAYQQFDLATKTEPTNVMAYFYRGVVAEMKGDRDAAKNDYQQALNLSPDFERAQKALDNLK